jgi:class 3 adenylate cyclase/tetratricopeptide (TPR) repeat protein
MSFKRRTTFSLLISIILSASLCLNAPCHPERSEGSPSQPASHNEILRFAQNDSYLAPKSDLDENDLKTAGWGFSVLKDIEKHAGRAADSLQIEDIFKVRKTASGDKTFEAALLEQGYKIDEIPDQETVLISGKGHGIILFNSLYEPAADILSAKQTVKKGSLGNNVSFIIYNDLYSGIIDELRGVEFDSKNLAAYVPIEILHKLIDAKTAGERTRDGSVRELFKEPLVFEKSSVVSIDLSGFTAMTDKLTEILAREKDPVRQAEAKKFVIEITNELFADIANVIDKFDASIIKFGGDARLVLLTEGVSATRALEMAQEVQLILRYFGGILGEYFKNVEAVNIDKIGTIRASIGISSGTAYLVVPVDKYGLKDVVPMGDVFYRAIQAQDEAKKGITITEETRQQLIAEGRDGLFSVHAPNLLPADRYAPEDRKILEDKKVHAIDQGKMSFLDYEVRDRINFTVEYITAVHNYLRKEKFQSAHAKTVSRITDDFGRWKKELGTMKAQVKIGDLSGLDRLKEMKQRIMDIRVAVDNHLLSFFPEKSPEAASETQETLAKMSVKRDYGRYVADRVGELFYKFRTEANRRAFYSKDTLEKVRNDLASFLPRGFEEYIVKEEKNDFSVERMNFQNARIMFVQVYGLKELYEKTLAEKGPGEAARVINDFYRKSNGCATPENGIIYLKSDPGAQYLKMIYLGGLKYLSGVNPDTEMIKLAAKLHETAREFGLEMKIGINSGPIILGLTGTNRRELTTISPEINLAARLGAYGKKGETIVSSRVYYASKDEVEYKERSDFYKDGARGIKVKGVAAEIPVFEPVKVLPVQKRGKFLRLKELAIAKEWIDAYLKTVSPLSQRGAGGHVRSAVGGGGTLDALLIQTKELGLGSETLGYEIERYAESAGFTGFGGKGKDEYEIMKTLLEEFCKITPDNTPGERLGKIQFAVSKYAPDMTEYYPILKILFPFIEFPASDIVENLDDDEKIVILNKVIEKFFTNKLSEVEDGKQSPIFLRIFDVQHIKGGSLFLAPLITALIDKNVLIEFVCNGPFPESLGNIEIPVPVVSPLSQRGRGGDLIIDGEDEKLITLANLLKETNRTIFVDRMDKGQILEVFHATCEFANRTALLREIDKLTLDDIRGMIDTDQMVKGLGLPQETVIGTIPLKDIVTHVKKLLTEKIYLLSGKGNPLIARHQAKRFIDLFYQKDIPETEKGNFILREVLSQNISGDNIDAFFHTQYNGTYFNNPRYRNILFDALCLGTEFNQDVILAHSILDKKETQESINELIDAGILRRGDLGRLIFDHYIYDVFIKHADIDNIRRGRLKLARLTEQLYKKEDGSIDPEHINELAMLYFNSFNLNLAWDKQKKTLGTTEEDLSATQRYLGQSARRDEELYRPSDAINTFQSCINMINYRVTQNIADQNDKKTLYKLFNDIGNIFKTLGDTKSCVGAFSKAMELCQSEPEKVRMLSDGIFMLYLLKGDEESLKKAETIIKEIGAKIPNISPLPKEWQLIKANYLNRFGIINFYKGNYAVAKESWDKGVKLTTKTDNKAVLGKIYINYGNLFREEGKLKESTKSLNKALAISKDIKDSYQIVHVLQNLATNYTLLGNPRKTLQIAQEAVKIAKEMNYLSILTSPLIYCGEGNRLLGRYQSGLGFYREAERTVELFGARADEKADLFKGLGICNRSDHQKSAAYFRKAIDECRKIGDKQLSAKIMLESYSYFIEECLRYGDSAQARDLIAEVEKLPFPKEIIGIKDIQIRLGVIERLKGEISLIEYQNTGNVTQLKEALNYGIQSFKHTTDLQHKLGRMKSFILLLKAFNGIPPDMAGREGYMLLLQQSLFSFEELERDLLKSRIPTDKILLAEIYYEMRGLSDLSPVTTIPQEKRMNKEYLGKAQNLLRKLLKTQMEDERIAILQEKLLGKPMPNQIRPTIESDEAA